MSRSITARVIHMHDVESNWVKCTSFVPQISEIIVYDPDSTYTYPRFKIGDGKTSVVNLPFAADNALDGVIEWDNEIGLIDGGLITTAD